MDMACLQGGGGPNPATVPVSGEVEEPAADEPTGSDSGAEDERVRSAPCLHACMHPFKHVAQAWDLAPAEVKEMLGCECPAPPAVKRGRKKKEPEQPVEPAESEAGSGEEVADDVEDELVVDPPVVPVPKAKATANLDSQKACNVILQIRNAIAACSPGREKSSHLHDSSRWVF